MNYIKVQFLSENNVYIGEANINSKLINRLDVIRNASKVLNTLETPNKYIVNDTTYELYPKKS